MAINIESTQKRIPDFARTIELVESNTRSTDTQKNTAVQARPPAVPDVVLKDILDAQRAANIQTGNLRNLIQKIDPSLITQVNTKVKTDGPGFLKSVFGEIGNTPPPDTVAGLVSKAPTGSRSPLPSLLSELNIGRDAMLSDDPPSNTNNTNNNTNAAAATGSAWDSFVAAVEKTPEIVEAIGKAIVDKGEEAGSTAAGVFGGLASAAAGILTANTSSPDDKANEFNGWKSSVTAKQNGSAHQQASDYNLNDPASWDGTRTPLPDDVSNPSGGVIVTRDVLNALKSLKNVAGQPSPDDDSSTNPGKINTGVNGTGSLGSVSQPAPDSDVSKRIAVTSEDISSLQVRVLSKIQTIR